MLREIRKARGLTMKELGDLVGVSESAIGLYEKGSRKPDYELLLKMGEVLNCSVDSILGNNFALTPDEQTFLHLYRQFKPDRRSAATQVLAVLLETEKTEP